MAANANVSIHHTVWSDFRYDVLARLIGCDRFSAVGRMAMLWAECTTRGTDRPPTLVIDGCLGHSNGSGALLDAGLGEMVDGVVRVRGCHGRIEWLESRRAAGKKSAEIRAQKRAQNTTGPRSSPVDDVLPTCSAPVQHVFNTCSTPDELMLNACSTPGQPQEDRKIIRERERAVRDEPALSLARCAVDEINRLTGRSYDPESKGTVKLAKALAKAKHTEADVLAVVRDKHAEWGNDPKMAERVCPPTLLAFGNFENYLDAVKARGGEPRKPAQIAALPAKRSGFGEQPIDWAALGNRGREMA